MTFAAAAFARSSKRGSFIFVANSAKPDVGPRHCKCLTPLNNRAISP
jgi:hypothetical protein